jgi:hypothetical protein
MADGSSASVSGMIIVIAILAVIGFVFFLLVFIMSQVRRLSLNRAVKKLIASEGNDTLRVSQKDLKKMYPLIQTTWNRRADIFPIPEVGRLPAGWLHDDGRRINIRDEIVSSFDKICQGVSLPYARLPHQTVSQFFNVLLQRRRGTHSFKPDTQIYDAYLRLYHLARYGPANVQFDANQYHQFKGVFNQILGQIGGQNH